VVSDRGQQQKHPSLDNPASYYVLLELLPSASPVEIRRSYRELSKRYHPDTTTLPQEIATAQFLKLNEAYATLSNPERRSLYDQSLNYSKFHVIQAPLDLNTPVNSPKPFRSSAYLDPSDRPLSSGEISALLFLGLALVGCLVLAIGLGLTRGNTAVTITDIPRATKLSKSTRENPQPVKSKLDTSKFHFPHFPVLSFPRIK
jgi:hypothetical protein